MDKSVLYTVCSRKWMNISSNSRWVFSPLAQMARLTEEVGELAREVNHTYGEKQKGF